MHLTQNHSNYYHCPGRNSLTDTDVTPKVHFPEQPKHDPLDIYATTDVREHIIPKESSSTYLQ